MTAIDFTTPGRMLSISKSMYRTQHPDHVIIFNANVLTKSGGKIWYGDLDLNLDQFDLSTLAATVNDEVIVLRELDARFERETKPNWDAAVAWFTPDGKIIVNDPLWKR